MQPDARNRMDNATVAPVLYIPHGGGPLPLLGDRHHSALVAFLQEVASGIDRPSAIVVVSAHWESRVPTVTSAAAPALIYDYSGFPPEAYRIDYPVPGEPALAAHIAGLLEAGGIAAAQDAQRGLDHGVFVPLKLVYPEADIPCVQLSLIRGLDPGQHIRMGEALSGLRSKNILVIGSGFSFHNMRAFTAAGHAPPDPANRAFEDWLQATCCRQDITEAERRRRLVAWEGAPHARYCHPREEHLLPLHVCYGIAGTAARRIFHAAVLGKQASAFRW